MKNKKQTKKGFKQLTEDDKQYIAEIHGNKELSFDDRMDILKNQYGKSERTIRKWTEKLGLTKPNIPKSPQYETAKKKKVDKSKKVYLITSAQSNTALDNNMLDQMEAYAEYHNAEILVIPLKYSVDSWGKQDHSWAKRVVPYLCASRMDLNRNLTVAGDVKILPTAKFPLSSMSSLVGINSGVFGSPKIHQESHAVLKGDPHKLLTTTGSVTKSNYSDTKVGKHAEHYHQMGFVVVEIVDKEMFHLRNVEMNRDGSFDDLFFHVENGEVTRNSEIEGIVLGDVHMKTVDEVALDTTFDLMGKLKPKHVVLHDVLDALSINHHVQSNPFAQAQLHYQGNDDLEEEIEDMLVKLGRFRKFKNVVVVRSNHDEFLEKYLMRDWRKMNTMKNSLIYMKLSTMILEAYKNGEDFKGVVPTLIKNRYPEYHALGYDEPYYIKHFAVHLHSHKFSNGSRGTGAKTWSKLTSGVSGHKERGVIIAHSHSPSVVGSAINVGHLLLPQPYTEGGPSSWAQANAIIHPSGRAQLIRIIDSKHYTTFK